MLQDSLSMHYTIANPAAWGIDGTCAILPVYSKETQGDSLLTLQGHLAFLQKINSKKLPEKERVTYRILLDYLKNELAGQSLSYYYEPLSPSLGIQSQLPILFAEYALRNRQDIDNYLRLLSQMPAYLDGVMAYEQEKSAAGLFMPDYSAKKIIKQCETIMDKEELRAQTHFLIVSFAERLTKLTDTGVISGLEKDAYLAENGRILTTMLQPAYDRLADCLTLLSGSGSQNGSLAALPEGRQYYLYLLRKNTGSVKDIPALKKLLLQQFENSYGKICALSQTDAPKAGDVLAKQDASTMLAALQSRIVRDFPAFPGINGQAAAPSYTLKTVSDCLAEYASPAFYLTPPIDDISENCIYVNPKNNLSGISLYTTLAHEGYPGHLYQTVYYHLYQKAQSIAPIRNILYFGGYTEGWAFYVEMLSYEYAKEMAADAQARTAYEIERLNKDLQLALYCLLDIAIHYDGASYEEVSATLAQFGIRNAQGVRSLYEYITEEPASYLKYYIGYLEILELKEKAKKLWGNAYSDILFHTVLLEAGPCNFGDIELSSPLPETMPKNNTANAGSLRALPSACGT